MGRPPRGETKRVEFLDLLGEYDAIQQAAFESARAAYAINATIGKMNGMVKSVKRREKIVEVFGQLVEREMELTGLAEACLSDLAATARSEPRLAKAATTQLLHDLHAHVVQAMVGIRWCKDLYVAALNMSSGEECFQPVSPLWGSLEKAYDAVADVDFILCEGGPFPMSVGR